jgi:uncharacterized repeat protein (TIGR01451 family)
MENDRRSLAAILSATLAILAVATGAAASPRLTMTLNQTAFRPGEIVEVTVAVQNAGPAFSADVYAGALLPDGTALFLTSLSPPVGTVMTPDANPASFPPLLADVVVPEGPDQTMPDFISFPFSEQHPRGEYELFAGLSRAASFADGRIDPGDLVAGAFQRFTFVDIGTGLSTAEIEVSPVSPTTSDAISIRLFGVWPDGCVPHDPRVRITGSEIRIDTVGAPPDAACLTVLSPWELTVVVGQLPAGPYRVVVINASQGRFLELGREAFDVQ